MWLNQVTLQISASGITALCTPHVGSGVLWNKPTSFPGGVLWEAAEPG